MMPIEFAKYLLAYLAMLTLEIGALVSIFAMASQHIPHAQINGNVPVVIGQCMLGLFTAYFAISAARLFRKD